MRGADGSGVSHVQYRTGLAERSITPMASQPFLWLRGRTYHFRRRVPFGSSVANPISISMKTRDPDRACILARRLAAR